MIAIYLLNVNTSYNIFSHHILDEVKFIRIRDTFKMTSHLSFFKETPLAFKSSYLLPSARKQGANTSTVSEGTTGSKSRRVRQVFTLSNNLLPKSITVPTEINVSADFSMKHFIIISIYRNSFVITDFRNLSVLVAVKWSSSRSNKNCSHFVSNKFLITFYL